MDYIKKTMTTFTIDIVSCIKDLKVRIHSEDVLPLVDILVEAKLKKISIERERDDYEICESSFALFLEIIDKLIDIRVLEYFRAHIYFRYKIISSNSTQAIACFISKFINMIDNCICNATELVTAASTLTTITPDTLSKSVKRHPSVYSVIDYRFFRKAITAAIKKGKFSSLRTNTGENITYEYIESLFNGLPKYI